MHRPTGVGFGEDNGRRSRLDGSLSAKSIKIAYRGYGRKREILKNKTLPRIVSFALRFSETLDEDAPKEG